MIKTVRVTKHDIEIGHRNSPTNCPIAIAIYHTIGNRVYVGRGEVLLVGNEKLPDSKIRLNKSCRKFIRVFDAGHYVAKPFSFKFRFRKFKGA